MKTFTAILLSLSFAGCAGESTDFSKVTPYDEGLDEFSCSRVDKVESPNWALDIGRPYTLEFGRGSGMGGLENTVIHADGGVVLTRFTTWNIPEDWSASLKSYNGAMPRGWAAYGAGSLARRATSRLSAGSVEHIARAVVAYGLLDMPKAYHANVNDGTQWVFWIRQDGRTKSVYFNNHFPVSIRRFATVLDRELEIARPSPWIPLTEEQFKASEKDIWDSLR